MRLEKLFDPTGILSHYGDLSTEIRSLSLDSRDVLPGGLFFALKGGSSDGHSYIDRAVDAGAKAVVCETMPTNLREGICYVCVEDSAEAAGIISDAFYGHPSSKLQLVGVTGTNGKTTTAALLYNLFRKLGYRTGLISTVVYRIDSREIESTHTTPDAIRLNAMLAEMVEAGCAYCFMEVSSHSIVQKRIAGLRFAGGIFTNLTHDHLDYHKAFSEYIRAKKSFFDTLPKDAFALVNTDDRNGSVMVQNTKALVKAFSLRSMADYHCRIVEMHLEGMLLEVDGTQLWVRLLGRFNAYNILGIYAAAMLLGVDKWQVLTALSSLSSVRGRFEYVRSESRITAIVDYAHTPDALDNVIETVNEVRAGGGRLIVVVGCGGDRDRSKRPEMARIAIQNSDLAILTSDNPRHEEPARILEDMKAGVRGEEYLVIADRRKAIKTAVMMSQPGDIILIAGKGHETYQDVAGVKCHFDDMEEVTEALKDKG